jgi:hypothetical protein
VHDRFGLPPARGRVIARRRTARPSSPGQSSPLTIAFAHDDAPVTAR